MTWAIDLDGVVWLGDSPVPGSAAAISRLRSSGTRVVFITNNSAHVVTEVVRKLQNMGIPATDDDVATSAQAAATLVKPGETALICAGRGVDEALQRRGVKTVRSGRVDAVVVGWHREFDYDGLTAATRAVRNGARLIGTNADATYPTTTGPLPGGGALLAAVAYASGVEPEVAGKPNKAMVQLVRERFGPIEVMVGDRAETDGTLAHRLGARFALVLSGVTDTGMLPVVPEPAAIATDLAALVPG
ncbi:MAG: HAD-IIA family hydrolase [Actinobacteria bacterium]|nr:HAD-IIA family hydrolase [Actinomycetota bacterium]